MTDSAQRGIRPTTEVEARFWAEGRRLVAGLDEVGRGAWAGPVYAAAVILPQDGAVWAALEGVRDSKLLSPAQRARLARRILEVAVAAVVGRAEAAEVDTLGIVPATRLAMRRALAALPVFPDALILDALRLPTVRLPQAAFPCADAHVLSVAAASILAKVRRDAWMAASAERDFPGYGFAQHKGYGTSQHQRALADLGVCVLHRRTFRPVALAINARESEKASERKGECVRGRL